MGCISSSEFVDKSISRFKARTEEHNQEIAHEELKSVDQRKYARPVPSAPTCLITFKDNKSDLSASIIRGFKSKSKDNVIVEGSCNKMCSEVSKTSLQRISTLNLGESSPQSNSKTDGFDESESSRMFDSVRPTSQVNEKSSEKEKRGEISSVKYLEEEVDQQHRVEMILLEETGLPRKGSLNKGIINPPTIDGFITNVVRRNSLEGSEIVVINTVFLFDALPE
jgi:hypothetical protein